MSPRAAVTLPGAAELLDVREILEGPPLRLALREVPCGDYIDHAVPELSTNGAREDRVEFVVEEEVNQPSRQIERDMASTFSQRLVRGARFRAGRHGSQRVHRSIHAPDRAIVDGDKKVHVLRRPLVSLGGHCEGTVEDESDSRPAERVDNVGICLEERPLNLRARVRHSMDTLDQLEVLLAGHSLSHAFPKLESLCESCGSKNRFTCTPSPLRLKKRFGSEQARTLASR